ncbi:hypothetical protein [Cytobacillus dafuensis]|uniref:Uncharacterized protein n=1 Tax=Cytobacillus dafuensis TaxID=1742359 RepID=A0A5B8Z5L7_CYTDA|nr:hypothetical protein [Cytobacillus dafuensis]QED48374.1 hypothetical protein FSZ17_14625 [Cytobacillus dafuensis]
MSDTVGLSLTILFEIIAFSIINFYVFKFSQKDIKRRIWSGVIFLLLTPLIFFGTLFFVLFFDESGWGAGILTVVFTGLYIINGILVLLSSICLYFMKSKKRVV